MPSLGQCFNVSNIFSLLLNSNMKTRIFVSSMILVCMSFKGRCQHITMNILDSNSVDKFIKNSTTCEQIQSVLHFTNYIVQEIGYGINILKALSKSTGYSFNFPIATGGILLTSSQRIREVKEQLNELSEHKKCNSK